MGEGGACWLEPEGHRTLLRLAGGCAGCHSPLFASVSLSFPIINVSPSSLKHLRRGIFLLPLLLFFLFIFSFYFTELLPAAPQTSNSPWVLLQRDVFGHRGFFPRPCVPQTVFVGFSQGKQKTLPKQNNLLEFCLGLRSGERTQGLGDPGPQGWLWDPLTKCHQIHPLVSMLLEYQPRKTVFSCGWKKKKFWWWINPPKPCRELLGKLISST